MPRNPGTGVYTQPAPDVVTGTTVESKVYNDFVNDVELDLNTPRPVVAGGTGASSAIQARDNLDAEVEGQQVTNYDTQVFEGGSFWSAAGATNAPVAGHGFIGIAYVYGHDPTNWMTIEARDMNDTTTPGRVYVRERKGTVWGAWTLVPGSTTGLYVLKAGDTMTGGLTVSAGGMNITGGGTVNGGLTVSGANLTINGANIYASSGSLIAGGGLVYLDAAASKFIQWDGTNFNVNGGNTFATTANLIARRTGPFASVSANNPAMGAWGFWVPNNINQVQMGTVDGNGSAVAAGWYVNATQFVVLAANSYKPGGGAWLDSSDARIKTVLGKYDSGLDEILKLEPMRYRYKGNDTPAGQTPENAKKIGADGFVDETRSKDAVEVPYGNSPHYNVAVDGKQFIGLIAQTTEIVMPELVTRQAAMIDGKPVTDLRDLDTSPLIFALINAVKELAARIEALEAGKVP